MTWLGVSDEAAPGHVSPHIAYSYYAGGAILLLTVLVTSFKTRNIRPGSSPATTTSPRRTPNR